MFYSANRLRSNCSLVATHNKGQQWMLWKVRTSSGGLFKDRIKPSPKSTIPNSLWFLSTVPEISRRHKSLNFNLMVWICFNKTDVAFYCCFKLFYFKLIYCDRDRGTVTMVHGVANISRNRDAPYLAPKYNVVELHDKLIMLLLIVRNKL